uniref:Alkane hydroxylase MAH1-like n=1 Tax=Cucumis melo TaxID=3656 RepID=A0A9I9CRK5_CUCME
MEWSAIVILSILLPFFIIFITFLKWNNPMNGIPWNWPVLGMLPTVVFHMNRINDRATEILHQAARSTFFINGVWFSGTDFFLTANPSNIHHILSANFEQYPKGPDFKYIFDFFGDGIFNSDFASWKSQRFLEKIISKKVKAGLFPVLQSFCENGSVLDLQDLFQRLSFDSTCMFVTGFDLQSLSLEFPQIPFSKAMDDIKDVAFLRHFFPKKIWEFQNKLQIGQPKKLKQAWNIMDETIHKLIALKKESLKNQEEVDPDDRDLLSSYIITNNNVKDDDDGDSKFLKDTVLNLMMAGRDSVSSALSWFFFCLSNNPIVEAKIREELETTVPLSSDDATRDQCHIFSYEELKKLVYFHGALCETLRLYPVVPFQHKVPSKPDILPSGHRVDPNTKILFSLYALGRMSDVWGEDCMEFKPERWINSKNGKIKHEPSYKFLAFNAGPRTCLGKEVAFIEMKLLAAAILHNFNITRQTEHEVVSNASIILQMKHGFKVKVTKRWT